MRARLLLQVEDREPVEVLAFEPRVWRDHWECPIPDRHIERALDAALTVEVREYLNAEPPEPDPQAPGRHETEARREQEAAEALRLKQPGR